MSRTRNGCWWRSLPRLVVALGWLAATGLEGQAVRLSVPEPSPTWDQRVDDLFQEGKLIESLTLLERVLQSSLSGPGADWRAARACHALGVTAGAQDLSNEWYREAVRMSEQGLARAPDDLQVLRWAVVATGTLANAPGVGPRETARYAQRTWTLATKLLDAAPDDPIAHSALGSMHAELMTMTGFERFLARRLLGVDAVKHANWDDAIAHQRRAVEADPERILFRLELGKALGWRGQLEDALEELDRALSLPPTAPTDALYREQAREYREGFALQRDAGAGRR